MGDNHSFGWTDADLNARQRKIDALNLPKSMTTSDGRHTVSAAAAKAVLNKLHDHAGGGRWSWPSQATIAQAVGLTRRTVQRALDVLQSRGIIEIALRRSDSSGIVCNHYSIQWPVIDELNDYPGHPECRSVRTKVTSVESDVTYGRERCDLRAPPMRHEGATDVTQVSHEPPREPTNRTTTTEPALAAVAAAMVECGVSAVWPAIEEATGRGVAADHLMALVDHWRAHAAANGWGAGALKIRIASAGPGQPLAAGWVKPSKLAQSRANKVEAEAAIADRHKRDTAARQQAETERAAREQRYGPQLDAMSDAQIVAMLRTNPRFLSLYRKRGRASPSIRQMLLWELSQEHVGADS